MVKRFTDNKELNALLALMCFHTARFDARIDDHGAIVLFEHQDRSLWNQTLINIGMQHLKSAMNDKKLTAYHIEASIAAEHCLSESFEATDWQSIWNMYQLLRRIKPNPIIQLNLAIIESQINGIDASLKLLDEIVNKKILNDYYLLPATQGIFYMKRGEFKKPFFI